MHKMGGGLALNRPVPPIAGEVSRFHVPINDAATVRDNTFGIATAAFSSPSP
jgi:hypothetical protein